MSTQNQEFKTILSAFDKDFSEYIDSQPIELLEIDGLTKINPFRFRKDYWSKRVDEVTINPNANLGNVGEHKNFCNLISELAAPINKLSALSLIRKYGNRANSNGNNLVKSIISGEVYHHNLTLYDLPYCIGLSLYQIINEGITFGGLLSNPPHRPTSFVNQTVRYIQYASNLFAGATALTDFFPNYSYFTLQKEGYSEKERENDLQNLIHGCLCENETILTEKENNEVSISCAEKFNEPKIFSLNSNNETITTNYKGKFENNNPEVFEITSDKVFRVTSEHPILITRNGHQLQVEAKNIQKGDLIPHLLKIDVKNLKEEIDLTSYLDDNFNIVVNPNIYKQISNGKYRSQIQRDLSLGLTKGTTWTKIHRGLIEKYICKKLNISLHDKRFTIRNKIASLPITLKFDKNLGKILGYYLAEGHVSSNTVVFSFGDEEILVKDLCDSLKSLGINYKIRDGRPKRNAIYIEATCVLSWVIKNVLKLGIKCEEKQITSMLLNTPEEFRWNLVEAMFLGDGNTFQKGENSFAISYVGKSKKLIETLSYLLLTLGITCSFQKNTITTDFYGNKCMPRFIYFLRIHGGKTANKFLKHCKMIREKYNIILPDVKSFYPNTTERFAINEFTYLAPVRYIEKLNIIGKKYSPKNINSETSLFIHSGGVITHNCTDEIRLSGQSPFLNLSIMSPESLRTMYQNYLWGDLKINDLIEETMKNQQIYCKFISKGQLGKDRKPTGLPYRFPITTLVADLSFSKEFPEIWEEILKDNANLCHLNFMSNMKIDLKSLSMCCRLNIDISDLLKVNINNTFGSFLQVGSHAVVSINMARIAYESKGDIDKFIELLEQRCEIARQLLKIHRNEVLSKRRLKYHYFFQKGGLNLKRNFFSTIGFIGIANAVEIMGLKITGPVGLKLAEKILRTMKNKSVEFSKADEVLYNIEEVPAEAAAGTLAQKDKLVCGGTYDYYDSQFVPLSYDVDLLKRIEIEGELQEHCTGGSISHLNLDGRPEPEALYKFTNNILMNSKLRQFAFNAGFTICKLGHNNVGVHKKCRTCGSEDVDWITRIVGYFTPVSSWNRMKQLEFKTRKWGEIK